MKKIDRSTLIKIRTLIKVIMRILVVIGLVFGVYIIFAWDTNGGNQEYTMFTWFAIVFSIVIGIWLFIKIDKFWWWK